MNKMEFLEEYFEDEKSIVGVMGAVWDDIKLETRIKMITHNLMTHIECADVVDIPTIKAHINLINNQC